MIRAQKIILGFFIVIFLFVLITVVILQVQNIKNDAISSGVSVNNIEQLMEYGRKGDFIISGSESTEYELIGLDLAYRHGHAFMIYSETEVINLDGPGHVSEIIHIDDLQRTSNLRLYSVKNVSNEEAASVAEYAKENLLGIEYDANAPYFWVKTQNCSTIIYHSYSNVLGVKLDTVLYSVLPKSLAEDEKTYVIANLNWPGNGNTFDI